MPYAGRPVLKNLLLSASDEEVPPVLLAKRHKRHMIQDAVSHIVAGEPNRREEAECHLFHLHQLGEVARHKQAVLEQVRRRGEAGVHLEFEPVSLTQVRVPGPCNICLVLESLATGPFA